MKNHRMNAQQKKTKILTNLFFQDYEYAKKFYEAAIATDKFNKSAINNYAVFRTLVVPQRDISCGESLFLLSASTERVDGMTIV
jgi:hypothetical protein